MVRILSEKEKQYSKDNYQMTSIHDLEYTELDNEIDDNYDLEELDLF